VIAMGEKGAFSRVLGPIVGNFIDYTSDAGTGPGQLSQKELCETYRYRSLNSQTEIYGLIGDPVEHSQGHIYHNKAFQHHNKVYVKMCVTPDELPLFMQCIKKLNFRGLSVTMPLKEKILPFVDHLTNPWLPTYKTRRFLNQSTRYFHKHNH